MSNANIVPQGTKLPVITTADLFPVVVIGMGSAPRPREQAKPTPAGEATYSSGCILLMERDGKPEAQKSASVHVIKPAATYELGRKYIAQGRVYVQPFENNSRVALSITVEQLVPVPESSDR